MKPLAIASLVAVTFAALGANRDDAKVITRRAALALAGARASDGFKLRDSHWTGTLQPGAAQVVQVNLFEGNRYWFTAASTPNAGAISIHVFDESGHAVSAEIQQDGSRAAAGFSPAVSGPHFVKLEQSGNHVSTFCLVYSYK